MAGCSSSMVTVKSGNALLQKEFEFISVSEEAMQEGFMVRTLPTQLMNKKFLKWMCKMSGMAGTLWQGATLKFKLSFSEKYPNTPPEVQFTPHLFHPNIDEFGKLHCQFLDVGWHANYNVMDVLEMVRTVVAYPEEEYSQKHWITDLYQKDYGEYIEAMAVQAEDFKI